MAPTGAGLRMVALKSWLLKSALSICGSGIAGGGGLNRKWIADSPKHTGISPAGWTCTQGKYGGSGKPRGELPYHILMTNINKAGRAWAWGILQRGIAEWDQGGCSCVARQIDMHCMLTRGVKFS